MDFMVHLKLTYLSYQDIRYNFYLSQASLYKLYAAYKNCNSIRTVAEEAVGHLVVIKLYYHKNLRDLSTQIYF